VPAAVLAPFTEREQRPLLGNEQRRYPVGVVAVLSRDEERYLLRFRRSRGEHDGQHHGRTNHTAVDTRFVDLHSRLSSISLPSVSTTNRLHYDQLGASDKGGAFPFGPGPAQRL